MIHTNAILTDKRILERYYGKPVLWVELRLGSVVISHFDTRRYLSQSESMTIEEYTKYSESYNVMM